MSISIIEIVIEKIVSTTIDKSLENLSRNEKISRIIKSLKLSAPIPPTDFEGLYIYSLIEYGFGKPKAILDFFSHTFIRDAFKKSFQLRDPSFLDNEAENLLDWSKIGQELKKIDVDPRMEFSRFTAIFNSLADQTRTVAEVKRDHKIDDVHSLLKTVKEQLSSLEKSFAQGTNEKLEIESLIRQYNEAVSKSDIWKMKKIMIEISRFKAIYLDDIIGLKELAEYGELSPNLIRDLLVKASNSDTNSIFFQEIISLIYQNLRSVTHSDPIIE